MNIELIPGTPGVIPAEVAAFIKGGTGGEGPQGPVGLPGVQYNLETWALTLAFALSDATRDANDAITTATIKWPDGVIGTFTSDVLSVDFPGAIDAWHGTHGAQTVTQPLMTRNANGAVIAQPDPIIS